MAYLGGLSIAVEPHRDPQSYAALQRSLDGTPRVPEMAVPAERGALTLADVMAAGTPADYAKAAAEWAGAV